MILRIDKVRKTWNVKIHSEPIFNGVERCIFEVANSCFLFTLFGTFISRDVESDPQGVRRERRKIYFFKGVIDEDEVVRITTDNDFGYGACADWSKYRTR